MALSPEFTTSEAGGAQLQALNTLINCGWRYVTRAEADQWRDGRRALPFLETQLRADLARINRIYLDERAYPFSEANIDAAVRRLADRIPEGVVRANERMTDDLMLGIALPQTIGATSREWPFKFIDWSDWRANTFQVTSEYTVSEAGGPTIRVDLVLFVNGIPLGVIEVKASHVSSDQGSIRDNSCSPPTVMILATGPSARLGSCGAHGRNARIPPTSPLMSSTGRWIASRASG
jgi:type I restriction enzyme R subunit